VSPLLALFFLRSHLMDVKSQYVSIVLHYFIYLSLHFSSVFKITNRLGSLYGFHTCCVIYNYIYWFTVNLTILWYTIKCQQILQVVL
jgi:hypothetical protein